jgi:hypothetical protein
MQDIFNLRLTNSAMSNFANHLLFDELVPQSHPGITQTSETSLLVQITHSTSELSI